MSQPTRFLRVVVASVLTLASSFVYSQQLSYTPSPNVPSTTWTPLHQIPGSPLNQFYGPPSNFDPYAPQPTGNPLAGNQYPLGTTLPPFEVQPPLVLSHPLILAPAAQASASRLIQPMMGNSFVVTRELELGLNNYNSIFPVNALVDTFLRNEIDSTQFITGPNSLDVTNFGFLLPALNTAGIDYTVDGTAISAGPGGPVNSFTLDRLALQFPTPISLSLAGQLKASDNGMPIPTDRLYANRSVIYRQPVLTRMTAGIEKTFGSGMYSIEGRLPLSLTFDHDIELGSPKSGKSMDVGDIQLGFKSLLLQQQNYAVSAGMYVSFPTAPGISLTIPALSLLGTPKMKLFDVDNRSFHFMPYASYVAQLSPRLIVQGFAQYDFAVKGNPISNLHLDATNSLVFDRTGTIKDPNFLHLDASASYWFQSSSNSVYRGTAPTVELHYSREFENTGTYRGVIASQDNGPGNDPTTVDFGLGAPTGSNNLASIVLGTHTLIGDKDTFSVGTVFPLTDNQSFEWRLLFNRSW